MEKQEKIEVEKLTQARSLTSLHLLENPNYFGTLKYKELATQFTPVLALGNYQNYFEELECIDYKPETKRLGAVVKIKQAGGYSGSPCAGGSREYVRFFVDYNRDGIWVDEGLAYFGIYDHPTTDDLCYYAEISLDPDKVSCCHRTAVLPRVKAILSWNHAPTAGDPNFPFVWGDVKESNIQIAPSNSIWCYILSGLDKYKALQLPEEVFQPDFENKFLPQLKENIKFSKQLATLTPSASELKELYGKEANEGRIAFQTIKMLAQNNAVGNYDSLVKMLPGFNLSEIFKGLQQLQFNTDYEELKCVSLNRDANTLHASVQLKRTTGFSGNLCTTGSKEFVAFYMDFGSGWQYMGTSSTKVHDIPNIPADGLFYDVVLGVNLDAYRKEWCQVSQAKVRAILSWNTEPTANDPEYKATWGDWEECDVEVQPLPAGVHPGTTTIVLEKVGGMVVTDIQNSTGLATSNLAGSLGGALSSPFYGTMELIGFIFNGGPGWSYRFFVTKPDGVEQLLFDHQVITTDTGGIFNDVEIDPDAQGWIPYLQSTSTNVVGGLLGRYGAYIPGKHTIRIQGKDSGGIIYDDPNGSVTILVDDKAPDVSVHIVTGAGDCADFTVGDHIAGTYKMLDDHAGSFYLSVTPNNGATVNVDATGGNGLSYAGGTLPNTGKTGTFVIDTTGVPKCGYNIKIDAADRTIVSSHSVGFPSNDIQGFCLRSPEVS